MSTLWAIFTTLGGGGGGGNQYIGRIPRAYSFKPYKHSEHDRLPKTESRSSKEYEF